jgi:hypothetical protein
MAAPFVYRRAPLLAVTAFLLSAPALAQEPTGGGAQEGSWFPADKKEVPRPPVDELKPDETAEKPAPPPRPATAPLPPPNSATPAPYVAPKPTSDATTIARRPKGNVAVYLGGAGAGGNLDSRRSMSSQIDGAAVFGLDLQFHVSPHFTLGGFMNVGAVNRQQSCAGSECNDGLFQLGVSAHYHLRPGRGVDPWLSAGTGVTTLSFSERQSFNDDAKTSATFVGFDLLHLQAGVDFRLGRVVALGPYVGLSNGVYTGVTTETRGSYQGTTRDTDRFASTTLHTWTSLGVRGRFNFF